ncbi:hypothetical protein T4D_11173 [Trichinella pseudospiralis]|uniref:Uncharacterized protein n=1 Tax=Trichinella pseudospiralis TaxID=6337 RepID=A0A0V1DMT4_TRIPS|nr:hypothetical protein T4D_11173 [Trichinella pseudospiralis]
MSSFHSSASCRPRSASCRPQNDYIESFLKQQHNEKNRILSTTEHGLP